MLPLANITWLHVEPTTKCNAHCPACARNNNGYGLFKDLVLESLSPVRFLEVLNQLPSLKTVQMCGTFGDPISSEYIKELVDICVERQLAVRIHTNGSVKTVSWWQELANKLKSVDHAVVFGIDGLEDTNHLYRRRSNWSSIMRAVDLAVQSAAHVRWDTNIFEFNYRNKKHVLAMARNVIAVVA